MRSLIITSFVVLSFPTAALAQSLVEQSGLSILVDRPTGADGGRVDCDFAGVDSCEPINLASCNGDGRPFDIQLTADTPVAVNTRLLVFVTPDADCQFAQESELDGRPLSIMQLNDVNDPLVTPDTFDFPEDFDNDGGDYSSVDEILAATGACDNVVNELIFRLCFVASPNDDIAESGEPFAAVQMLVDTVPPGAPTRLEASPGDSRLEITVDSDDQDIRTWTVRSRVSVDEATCDTWTAEESTDEEFNVVNQGEQSFEITVENGNSYDICVFGEDGAGNPGEVSPTLVATPRDECDFIECFPGELETGYCGAGGASGLAALLAFFGLLRRRMQPC
ncbi:MAG: hypothetical protein AAF654_10285 [Myxococcota bacterium]